MRKLLAVLLALCLVIPCAFAEEDSAETPEPERYTCGDYAYILLGDGTAEIVGYTGCEKSLTIPDSLDGIPVAGIGENAFFCNPLQEITIPDSVRSIGTKAFSHCYCLTEITIPDSVTSIGNWAFESCIFLKEITIPASVTSIGNRVFDNCNSPDVTVQPDSYAEEYCKEEQLIFWDYEGEAETVPEREGITDILSWMTEQLKSFGTKDPRRS